MRVTAERGHAPPDVRGAVPVDIELLAGRHTGSGRCLVVGHHAAVDLPGPGSPRTIATAAVPGWLAGLLRLGPRPESPMPGVLVIGAAALDEVLRRATPEAVAAVLAPERLSRRWLERLATIAGSMTARWRVRIHWADQPSVDSLEVIDSAAAGLWAVHPCPADLLAAELGSDQTGDRQDLTGDRGDVVTLAPTTPTTVWAWLSRLAAAG